MSKVFKLVQGDIFELNLTVTGGDETAEVDKIYFSCRDQGIVKQFENLGDDLYFISISPDETKKFNPKITSFDITVIFDDGGILTEVFQNKLEVLRKRNLIE